MAIVEFRLPDLGEGLTEATIVSWAVAVGDEVALDQALGELETDKALTEMPSPVAGRVVELAGEPGDVIAVGAVLVRFDDGTAVAPSVPPVLVGTGAPAEQEPVRRRRAVAAPAGAGGSGGAVGFAPNHLEPLEGYRAVAAGRLARSRRDIPDAAASLLADATGLDARVVAARRQAELDGDDPSLVTPFVAVLTAVVEALRWHPRVNASFDEVTGQVRIFDRIDLAVAVDTPLGLAVPVIVDAGSLGPGALGRRLHDLADAARAHRLSPTEASGGTFSVTNHGRFGTDDGLPIVNPPAAAILAVGRIGERPVVREGAVVAAVTAPLTLAFDHRVIDGADAARFLTDLAALLSAR